MNKNQKKNKLTLHINDVKLISNKLILHLILLV
jgi:hypothetical protein